MWKVTTLDLSNFNTSNVTNMQAMFQNTSNLSYIYVSPLFTWNQVTSHASMFSNANKIIWWNWTKYDSTKIDKTYAHVDTLDNPWYFTDPNNFTVKFLSWNEVVDNLTWKVWETATWLNDSGRSYTYYSNQAKTNLYDFAQILSGYTEIYVSWINNFKVEFDTDGWEPTIIDVQYIEEWWKVEKPDNPQKTWYTFTWWYISWTDTKFTFNEIVDRDLILLARYEKNKYTITWKNDDWSDIDTTQVEYQDMPIHSSGTKSPDVQYTYIFVGWMPDILPATVNTEYTAVYDKTLNKYTIKFIDGDWQEISSEEYDYWTPKENIQIPTNVTKTFTAMTWYVFTWWDKEIWTVTTWATYTAQFEEYTRSYLITWKNGNGEVIDSWEVLYWVIPNHADVESGWNAEYTYIFSWWIPKIVAVTTWETYIADYMAQKNKYLIKFVNEDGTVLQSGNVEYWETPVYLWEVPKKSKTEQYTYIFTWWWESILPVTWPKVYTAHYDEMINKYTITWINWDGNILYSWDVDWWEMPVYSWSIPTKTSTVDYNYTFNWNWLPEIKEVTWDMQYVAQFDEEYIKREEWWNYSWAWKRKSGNDTKQTHWSADEDKSGGLSNEGTSQQEENTLLDNSSKTSEWGNTKMVTIKNTEIVATVRDTVISNNSNYTKEFNEAYSFAKSNGITTTSSIDKAKMNTSLTRIEMAKMLSNYAINILWKEPDASKWIIKFNDVTNKLNSQYDNAVTKAYQLWIMWQNMKNNEFRPNDEVTRAEFATALSRLLYQTEEWKYKWTWKYYEPYMAKLYNEWIINVTDPKMKEMRWYVMIMLMKTVQLSVK